MFFNPLKWECEANRRNFPTMNTNKIYEQVHVLRADALYSLTQTRHGRHIKFSQGKTRQAIVRINLLLKRAGALPVLEGHMTCTDWRRG
jgi:hypothetical protein